MDLTGLRRHTPNEVTRARREAAVLAPVIKRGGEAHMLFTKRAAHLGRHPGQMSFPGGGREPIDRTLTDTALREANEEVGMRADEVDVVGRLDDTRTSSAYRIRPFVGVAPDREYVPDESEVAEVAVLPVSGLTDPANYETERRTGHPEYGDHRIHFFHVDGYTVWGATGQMVVQLLERTTDWRAPEEVDRVVGADAELPI
ncbi:MULTISPECIES: NUDIX hydrolase [Halorubrum]|uniref:Coenzyme A pyrophosphatase n=1 Tax=Halorubrum persicum TaxID=1383844 RepID=A0A2G1WJN3_9EURY|nr:CoA pyrophosphatase [Halorubrum persicum]OYR82563.1 coenzyme A pyrophosphatase [Halorubrum sp. E3]PHQ39208.1 coenzyme A pyrophosphatase [Halorubrum persicum]